VRIIGFLATAAAIFVVGFLTGGYLIARIAYIAGAQAAFEHCEPYEMKIEASTTESYDGHFRF